MDYCWGYVVIHIVYLWLFICLLRFRIIFCYYGFYLLVIKFQNSHFSKSIFSSYLGLVWEVFFVRFFMNENSNETALWSLVFTSLSMMLHRSMVIVFDRSFTKKAWSIWCLKKLSLFLLVNVWWIFCGNRFMSAERW